MLYGAPSEVKTSNSSSALVSAAAQEGLAASVSSSFIEPERGNGAASQSDQLSTTRLLQRFDVKPTSSRAAQGTRDVSMLILIAIPFVVLRAARYILSWVGITEHR